MIFLTLYFLIQTPKISEIKYFGNPRTPNEVFFEMVDIYPNDEFDLNKAKQLQQTFIKSGYYDKVRLISFPKNNQYVLNYYFNEIEDNRKFTYGVFLDPTQNLGLSILYSWDFINNTTMRFKSTLSISKNITSSALSFYDNFVGYNIFYDFTFGIDDELYLYKDIEFENDLRKSMRFMDLKLGYKLTNKQMISTTIHRFALGTNQKNFNNGVKEDFYTEIGLEYENEDLDWYLFPKEGYHIKASFKSNESLYENDFNSTLFQGKAYFKLSNDIGMKTGVFYSEKSSYVSPLLLTHFETSSNLFAFQNQNIGARKMTYLFNEISLISNIEYDPNLENELMWNLGIEYINCLNSTQKNKVNHIIGINLNWVYKKDLYKLSITMDERKNYYLNLILR